MEQNPTFKRFPRTLAEAFPEDADAAQWFYPPERQYWGLSSLVGWAGVLGFLALIIFLLKD